MAYNTPHKPHSAPQWAKDHLETLPHHKQKNLEHKEYFGAIKSLDTNLERLWESAKTLERETIFIFSSDNGAAAPGCSHPYRGWKSHPEEGGIRAVSMVMSTKRTYPTRLSRRMIHVTDWFSTILGMAQAPIPETNAEHKLDAMDFSAHLLGEPEPSYFRDKFIVFVRHTLKSGKVHMQVVAYDLFVDQSRLVCRQIWKVQVHEFLLRNA